MEGSTIGAYRVLRKLGEGGMGVVYVAEHALLGRKAAIKVLLPELSANKDIVQRFFNEARAVTQIADPGIVQVFDFGYHVDGSAFIVLELLDGESMDARLKRIGRFSSVDCLRLMRQICTSLNAAHLKGVVHRDLKPENLFIVGDPAVTGGERAKILDFGIAKLSGDDPGRTKTRTGTVIGTPVYMSPEQCRGAGEVDHRSDIYSIGCVMMTMLTGAPPFQGEGSGDLIMAHMASPPPFAASRIHGLPPIFDQILQRSLAKSPNDRFQSMSEMAEAIGYAEQTLYQSMPGGDGSGYVSSGRTPMPPSLMTPMPPGTMVMPAPTTLTGATGQASPPATGRRAPVIAGAFVIAAAVIAIVVVIATRRGTTEPHAASAGSALEGSAVEMKVVITPDAAPIAPIAATAPIDAGVDAAVVVVQVVIDAGVPVTTKPPRRKPKNPGGNDARGSDSTFNRGD